MKNKIVNWLKRQLKESNTKGFVLGLSGGIDSSVVALLCKLAAGPSNVLAVVMPCHSLKNDESDALIFAKEHRIKVKKIDLSRVYDSFQKVLPKGNNLSNANIKPRLRMTALYYYASINNCLVAGTGNKSELSIGYFTKYGDGGADILPIGDLYKRDVYKLAKQLNIRGKIISKPPSAGLWHGQTDESEMGITYKSLDNALCQISKGKSKKLPLEHKKVAEMKKKALHKLSLPKICKI